MDDNDQVTQDPQVDEESTDEEEEITAPEGARRNPTRRPRGINRRNHNDEFVTLIYSERGLYLTETFNLAHIASLDHNYCNPQDDQLSSIMERMHRETDEHGLTHF